MKSTAACFARRGSRCDPGKRGILSNRFDRQIALFGKEGQERLAKAHAVVIGAGGLGSHIVQQLAFLGVGRLTIVDPQTVEESNLNRLVGATSSDVGQLKVDVAARLVSTVDPSIEVRAIAHELHDTDAFDAVKAADVICGCVDHDGPRAILTELSAAYEKPYFDVASEVIPGIEPAYGGRMVCSHGGNGCLSCLDELSLEDVREYFQDPGGRDEESRLYGVPRSELEESGPSVVSINGVVASLAVTEFMVLVTGLRLPHRLLRYHGRLGKVTVGVDPPLPSCFYCKSVYGLREKAVVERYRRSP